tara:strand:- start:3996 stop:4784 length:789 start_codon:yes stop_codon:yes gene_type:complete
VSKSEKAPLHIVKTKKRIAIVGGSESWELAPFDDKSWEIWVLGNQVRQYDHKRIDLIFEIHNDFSNREEGYAQWLPSLEFPMVVGEDYPIESEFIEVFDFAKARELAKGDYLTSTPAYMTAYALYSRPDIEEIGYWGVDMGVNNQEYFYEQPIMQRWLGICTAKDIKITLPQGCPLGEPNYMEGVTANAPEPKHPFSEGDFKQMAQRHQGKQTECTEQIRALELKRAQHDAAIQVYEKLSQVGRAVDGGQEFGSLTQTLRTL